MPNSKPNILFIIIDSLRSDKFFETNYQNKNIKKLLTKSIAFNNTISCSNATILSWTGLFTSKYPFKTGIRSEKFNRLNSEIITCFDILKNNDYSFYGYLPKLSETIGLFPPFKNGDVYYDFFMGLTNGLGDKVIKKIKSISNQPWFFLVHTMDLHDPIHNSKEYNSEKYGRNSYEKKLSEIDDWLGRIFSEVDHENTVIVITGDHGSYIKSINYENTELNFNPDPNSEIFISKITRKTPEFLKPLKNRLFFAVEKRKSEKKAKFLEKKNLSPHEKRALLAGKADKDHFLFDELIKVPLIIANSNFPKNKIIEEQIRTVDIFPTIFDYLGINFHENIDGISQKELVNGKKTDEFPAYIESNPLVLTSSNDVIGIRTSKFKYFRDVNDSTKRVHLYNLLEDPLEENNISTNDKIVKELEKNLTQIIDGFISKKESNEKETKEIESELKKLGYV